MLPNKDEIPDWDRIHARAQERMAQVDMMPPAVRALIHDYNVNAVVDAFHRVHRTPEAIRAFLGKPT